MTTIAVVLAVLAFAVVLNERRRYRIHSRWLTERERIAQRDERLAQANGHPHTGQVAIQPVNGFDHPEPEELVG